MVTFVASTPQRLPLAIPASMPTAGDHGMRDFHDLADRVRERFPAMSPQFRLAARFLLDHADDVAVSSMRAVAAHVGVQPPTLVRFAQTLGFVGWQDLRDLCIAQLRSRPAPYAARAKALVRREEAGELMTEIFHAQRRNLDATEVQDREALPRAARIIERARTVHVAGFRACYPIAFAFTYVYRLFRPSVVLLGAEGGTLEMQMRAIGRGDAALVISFAPYSREANRVAQAAREARCRVVALTDSALAPIALDADARLGFSVSSPSFFPSTVAGLAVAESLLEILASRGGNDAVRRIEASERQLFASGVYEQASDPRAIRRAKRSVGR